MITFNPSFEPLSAQHARALVVFVRQGSPVALDPSLLTLFPSLEAVVTQEHFNGAFGRSIAVPILGEQLRYLVLIGIGAPSAEGVIPMEQYRRALGKAIRMAEQHRWHSIALQVPQADLFGVSEEYIARQTAETAKIAVYAFDKYITDPERKSRVTDITLVINGHDKQAFQEGVTKGRDIAHAVNLARHWIDLPPVALTPAQMVAEARQIAQDNDLKMTVFTEEQINKMGMGGLAAVAAGSDRDCQFIILEYSSGIKSAQTLGFVGKGITFDSGGLSIKPAESMETMKDDMAGSAAVLAAMEVLAKLKPQVNIVGFMPMTENLPSGKATKPGDIITFYNGKTAEVKNTDAEGRLILADALSYAEKHYKLDAIVDLATLTGSCAAALGPHFSGLMTQHEGMAERLTEYAARSGDAVWRLPMPDDYRVAIKSPVADLANIGSSRYKAGAITAGLFLSNFIEKTPWAHLDIAGSAFNVPDISYYRSEGATGVGVHLLVEMAMNWKSL